MEKKIEQFDVALEKGFGGSIGPGWGLYELLRRGPSGVRAIAGKSAGGDPEFIQPGDHSVELNEEEFHQILKRRRSNNE